MKSILWFYPAILLLLLTPNSARAEETGPAVIQEQDQSVLMEMDIDDLRKIKVATVFGASKYEQKVTEAPSSISIITSEEIRKYGYRTLADILRSARGLYVTYDRNYAYVGVRGFGRTGDYSNRILILVDGHRTNDNIFTQGFIGTDFILDVDLIDRVEVIRGPGASLYGSNAFFGVVNIITRRGPSLKGVETSGEAASFETYKGRVSYGNTLQNGSEMLVSGTIYDSDGQRLYFRDFDAPATNNGISNNCDYDRNNSIFAKISSNDFTLEGGSVYRKKGIPTGSWGTIFNYPRTFTVDERAYLELKYEHDFSGTQVMSRFSYDRYYYHGDFVWDNASAPPPVPVTNNDSAHGDWLSGEMKFTKNIFDRHKATLGAEFQNSIRQNQLNYDEEPYTLYVDDKRKTSIWGLYFQDEFGISKNLNLNAGVRYDHYDTFGATTNPRVALLYNPAEKTTVKVIAGRAFRAPSAYELYWNPDAQNQKLNPDLKPETINTYELVLEQYFQRHFRGTITGFYNQIDNLISQITDPADNKKVYRNVDSVEARGVEAELEGKWDNGLFSRISYVYQKSKDSLTGELIPNSPRSLAKFNVTAPLASEKLFAGAEIQYASKRRTNAGNELGGFFLTNVTLFSQKIAKDLELSGSVYNVFDKQYSDPASEEHRPMDSIGQDGRSFRVKATYRF